MKKAYRTPKHVLKYLKGHHSVGMNPFRDISAAKEETPSRKKPTTSVSCGSGGGSPLRQLEGPDPGAFPIDVFPSAVRDVVLHLATRSPLPLCMVAMAALAVVAGAIGRKFATSLSSQEEPTLCNLFTLFGVRTTKGKNILGTLLRALLGMERCLQSHQEELAAQLKVKVDVSKDKYKYFRRMITKLSLEGEDTSGLEIQAENLLKEIKTLKKKIDFSYELCMRHPTGAALRKTLAKGDQSVFLFSLDGGSILEDAFSRRDRLLTRFLLSGFSGEDTGSETGTCGRFGGEALITFLFAVQPHILYELLFNQKAAKAGLLNRPLVIDAEFLYAEPSISVSIDGTRAKEAWGQLIQDLVTLRYSSKPATVTPWCTEAEALFDEFDEETKAILATWPEEASQHSGRVRELAVRIAGVFLAIEAINGGAKQEDTRLQRDVAERAIPLMRWLFRHRLRIQKEAFRRHLAALADELEAKLKKNNGVLRISRIRDSHPQIHCELDFILEAHPDRFRKGEERKGNSGPMAKTVILRKIAA